MRKINDILKQHNLKPHRYIKEGNVIIVDTDQGKYVLKEKKKNNKIYNYLNSRNFNYYPQFVSDNNEDYDVMEYIEECEVPNEQKIMDLIDLVSLLHSKTTHYQEVTDDDYKAIYEDVNNNIVYLNSYYNDLINIIDSKVYMSPSQYLLARNISKIFAALRFSKSELDAWYEIVKKSQKKRIVVLHNNLDLSHFLRNNNSYLISWDKSKIDIPIFDLYKLYKRNGLDFEFSEVLKRYEKNYPLLPEEKKLLFILMALPDKIELNKEEYENCKEVNRMVDFVYKTEMLVSPYYTKEGKTE
ncbi:MAG: hypothetical protein E7165_01555 [Firmicutes bacterium]|nr:hypothetical protein [Bacillota bacterium]